MKTYMLFCAWKWSWNCSGESLTRQAHRHSANTTWENPSWWCHHSARHYIQCKGHWPQTTYVTATICKCYSCVLMEQPPIITYNACERAFTNWKSRSSSGMNVPKLLHHAHISWLVAVYLSAQTISKSVWLSIVFYITVTDMINDSK